LPSSSRKPPNAFMRKSVKESVSKVMVNVHREIDDPS
jgi:hypothetical protein